MGQREQQLEVLSMDKAQKKNRAWASASSKVRGGLGGTRQGGDGRRMKGWRHECDPNVLYIQI